MAASALDPCVTRSSANIVLNMQIKTSLSSTGNNSDYMCHRNVETVVNKSHKSALSVNVTMCNNTLYIFYGVYCSVPIKLSFHDVVIVFIEFACGIECCEPLKRNFCAITAHFVNINFHILDIEILSLFPYTILAFTFFNYLYSKKYLIHQWVLLNTENCMYAYK